MSKDKKKNHNYGSFVLARNSFQQFKRKAVLGILVLIVVVGFGSAIFKYVTNKPKTQAEIKVTDNTLPGWWLQDYFGSSVCSEDICKADNDPDKDGLTNAQEYFYHTDPFNLHTAKDTLNDGQLVAAGFDPSKPGHVTFDEVANPDNLFGESLVFAQDVQQMVADSKDISKVALPLVEDDKLQIIEGETPAIFEEYTSKLQSTIGKYFRKQDLSNLTEILKSGSDAQIADVKLKAALLASDLKTFPVPKKFLMFHKYNISMFQLLSEILSAPTDLSGTDGDAWYDKVQQFLAVQQKLSFEQQFLAKEFSPQ